MDIIQNITSITTITLTEIERSCGFPKSSMRKWSENIPSINKVAKVAEFLEVSLDVLYYGKVKTKITGIDLTLSELDLLAAFSKLTHDDQMKFIGRMEQCYEDYPPETKENES